ncbi:MAG: class I SAM-dependent methyltransferase [Anaerolineales bacterium]|nr:class I SAM-dependent methyltransferase [Anaerolineales bacterium]
MFAKDFILNFDDSNFKDGVYIHSKAPNSDLYELMWTYQKSPENPRPWGINRIPKFLDFVGGLNHWPKNPVVLDLACGLGRFTIASLELGAKFVVSCDGSYTGPKHIHDMVTSANIAANQFEDPTQKFDLANPATFGSKHLAVQVDISRLAECLRPGMFDLVFIHMAIHHLEGYQEALKDMAGLLKEDGILLANYWVPGTMDNITYEMRSIFLNEPRERIRDFFIATGHIKTQAKQDDFNFDSFLDDPEYLSDYASYKEPLQKFSEKYGRAEINQRLHWENMQTPYLHNFSHAEVVRYVQDELGFKVLNKDEGRIYAKRKTPGLLGKLFNN